VWSKLRKGENIRKRNDGRWEGRYYTIDTFGNTKLKSVYAKSYREVKEKLKAVTCIKQPNTAITSLNVEQAHILWLDTIKPTIKKSTYSKYYDLCYKHIISSIGRYKLNYITQSLIDNFISDKLKHGRIDGKGGLSPKTVKSITHVLKQCLNKYGLIFEYKVVNMGYIEMPCLSELEQKTFESYLLLDTDYEKLGLLFALKCGLRLGELCALRFKDIDIDSMTLSVNKTLQRIKNTDYLAETKTKIIIDTPKSQKSIRVIPLPSNLCKIIRRLYIENAYILTGNSSFVEPRTMQYKFKGYLAQCNISDYNFHALRHSFATKCVQLGFDLKSLSEILGHSSVKFTIDRYVHSDIEQKRIQMEKLSN